MAKLTAFLTQHEVNYRTDDFRRLEEAVADPALMINPAASVGALMASVQARASVMHDQLKEWACVSVSETSATTLAEILEPLAAEVELLLEALRVKLANGANHG